MRRWMVSQSEGATRVDPNDGPSTVELYVLQPGRNDDQIGVDLGRSNEFLPTLGDPWVDLDDSPIDDTRFGREPSKVLRRFFSVDPE